MKTRHLLLILLIVAVAAAWGVRMCCCEILVIRQNGESPVLLQGDRVLVDRWAYGLRTWMFTDSLRRLRPANPVVGDWVAVNTPAVQRGARPDTSLLCVGRVLACPGDTVWMGPNGAVSSRRNYRSGQIWPLMMPARGSIVKMNPWSAPIYARIIQTHEPSEACVRDTALCVDGHVVEQYRFTRDYYWIASARPDNFHDSRAFGPVPFDFFVGRVTSVLYSLDSEQPWWHCWRKGRIGRIQ